MKECSSLPLHALAESANAYASANGIQVERRRTTTSSTTTARKDDPNDGGSSGGGGGSPSSYYESAPISLLPNAYPASGFRKALTLAPDFNVLVDRISRDAAFLRETLGGGVAAADPYTAKLLQLYGEIYVDGTSPNAKHAISADRLGIHRSDYMLNDGAIKQVELNTIAASFAGLSSRVASLHSYLVKRFSMNQSGKALDAFLKQNQDAVLGTTTSTTSTTNDGSGVAVSTGVPSNPALEALPGAMNAAVEHYRKRFAVKDDASLIVLFVVQEGETNTVDQRMLEFQLFQKHGLPVVRLSLERIHEQVKTDPSSGALLLTDGEKSSDDDVESPPLEIALVYFRAGYAPTDYPSGYDGAEWKARAQLEASRATKCPSLGYHLAGTKKVQQQLARPGVLERFFPNASEKASVDGMRSAFAGLYSLGEDATQTDLDAVRDAMSDDGKGRYVLKPQREGGGYNYYGDSLQAKLKQHVTLDHDSSNGNGKVKELHAELGEFILMERLFPPQQQAILLRGGRVEGAGASISEFGCFGSILVAGNRDDERQQQQQAGEEIILHNAYSGFLLRTKFANVDEGGVASGFATLSSPYLC